MRHNWILLAPMLIVSWLLRLSLLSLCMYVGYVVCACGGGGVLSTMVQNQQVAPTARWVAGIKTVYAGELLKEKPEASGKLFSDDEEALEQVRQLFVQAGFPISTTGPLLGARKEEEDLAEIVKIVVSNRDRSGSAYCSSSVCWPLPVFVLLCWWPIFLKIISCHVFSAFVIFFLAHFSADVLIRLQLPADAPILFEFRDK